MLQNFGVETSWEHHLEEQEGNRRMMLNWIIRKYVGRVVSWNELSQDCAEWQALVLGV
jgi:hypothetical protein